MGLTNILLGYTVYQLATSKSRTVVPPTISKAFTVSDGQVDESYLQQMGEYMTYLKLNVTPGNVNRRYGQLLDYVASDRWNEIQPQLVREASLVVKNNVSSTFFVDETQVNLDDLKVRFKGTLQKWVGNRALNQEPISYVVQFTYTHSVLELVSMTKEATE